MKSFKKFISEDTINLQSRIILFEYQIYRNIPGTNQSYRTDSADINTITRHHSHVYARKNGKGKELYAVNIDGTGHDGCRNCIIPTKHAEFFRNKGYAISSNNILEEVTLADINSDSYFLIIINE